MLGTRTLKHAQLVLGVLRHDDGAHVSRCTSMMCVVTAPPVVRSTPHAANYGGFIEAQRAINCIKRNKEMAVYLSTGILS
jgi:hypothetical protein